MRTIEIPVNFAASQVETTIDSACSDIGLVITLKTTLKTFPGSLHWHIKKAKAKGTLEITLLPAEAQAWFSVHDNRTGDWIDSAIQQLQTILEAK